MRKHVTAALLALVLAAGALGMTAAAARPGGTGEAGSRLTGAEREVYQVLRREVEKVASGERSSTAFQIPDLDALSWSLSELGVSGESRQAVVARLDEKFKQSLDIDRVYGALSADCPYELYWRDLQYSWSYDRAVGDGRGAIRNLTIRIKVSQDYRGGGDTTVNSLKAARGRQAAESAQAIVERCRDLPDYEKLAAYRREVCGLVSYNKAAAGGGAPYGDPWQLVYVFDGDPATNVVCEGYAKAFKYLCDLSQFSGDVVCYTVSGKLDGGSHMWNVVRMEDGENYLVDVTNCDDGAAGAPDKLFLVGGAAGDGGRSYTVSGTGRASVYTYEQSGEDLFADGWLELSGTDYQYDPSAPKPPAPDTGFSDVKPDSYCAGPVAWAVKEKITDGTSETTFTPERACTHGEILTFLWRAEKEPEGQGWAPIPLSGEEFYAQAVCWAAQRGMVDQDLDPNAPCTRAEAVRYIWMAFDSPEAPACAFDDVEGAAPYAPAVAWAVEQEVTNGASETAFNPDGVCKRGEIVTFLYRAYH